MWQQRTCPRHGGWGGGATLQLRAALCTSDGTSVVALVMSCMVAAMLAHAALTASLTPVRMWYAHGRLERVQCAGCLRELNMALYGPELSCVFTHLAFLIIRYPHNSGTPTAVVHLSLFSK